ncbi:cation-translocating P-type ATPase [Mycoplasmopsis opalescens]|uniref:cation-translocating P-type ATPase n=1 Tax=Mycoplasmopsis opalescens TaxID=114886 RepID=UPI0004A777F5|nr:cation-translocating P-type ATPase [Mycoplasmopsis opalescens]
MNETELLNYNGLSSQEADNLQKTNGKNLLAEKKRISPFIAFFKQFADPMIILLLIGASISLGLCIYEHVSGNKSTTDLIISYIEPGIILLVVILNSMIGAYQEIKSDQAVRALAKLNQSNTTVMRDGQVKIIPSSDLVVGDLIILAAGDTINADCKIISAHNLEVVEASLTGESDAVIKEANLNAIDSNIYAENKHLLYSGTYVTKGKATAIVIAIAKNTAMGKINQMVQQNKKGLSPLQTKLNKLSRIFGFAGIILLFLSFIIQVLLNNISTGKWNNYDVYTNALVTGISLAVAAIPEGLITFTTVLLSIGVSKLAKNKALAKNLLAVETLGSANVICTDKTGTLTENKMTLMDAYINDKNIKLSSLKADNNIEFLSLAKYLTLCNDAFINYDLKTNTFEEIGDPTETGLLRFAYSYGIEKEKITQDFPILDNLPFDSDRKMHSVLVNDNNNYLMITKGAPDQVLARCKNIDFETIEAINNEWAEKCYRILAVAKRTVAQAKITHNDEKDLEFVGLVALMDPPRASVYESINKAHKAGIKVVMITGDHISTAKAIAKELNIYSEGDMCVSGTELEKMTDEELFNNVEKISVYARVNPADKLRIVKAWQMHNKVAAMTGDGVNDAPALKVSDIGCAMGITGTEVSKQASDLILVDDNFSSIVGAVENGRKIFDRIKAVIMNLLVSSIAEIIVMLFGMVLFYLIFKDNYQDEFFIFSASQLLWINLVSHGIPAIALGFVVNEDNVMNRKPFNKNESIFSRGMGYHLLWQSMFASLLTMVAYTIGALSAKNQGLVGSDFSHYASTPAFITLGICCGINTINLFSGKSIFASSLKKYWLVYVAALSSVTSILIIGFVPDIAKFFKMGTIYNDNNAVITSIICGFGVTIIWEFIKLIKFIKNKNISKNIVSQ